MNQENQDASPLRHLRRLARSHCGGTTSALRLAEEQAEALRRLLGEGPHRQPTAFRRALPGVRIVLADIPTSGLSVWDGECWVIAVNRSEPLTRRRLTILHEYKHIIDHPDRAWLYHDLPRFTATAQAEQAADYFAGCALVPSPALGALWGSGLRDIGCLARIFDVSAPAVRVRVAQLRLVDTGLSDHAEPGDNAGSAIHSPEVQAA